MRRPRELLAVLIVVVGGTLWLVVPDRRGGSLRDRSVLIRAGVERGELLAAWVMVENAGERTITLSEATLSSPPDGVEFIGTRARLGLRAGVYEGSAAGPAPFLRLAGFRIPPGRGATIGFGLRASEPGLAALAGVTVRYVENGDENTLRVRRTTRLCVSPGDC